METKYGFKKMDVSGFKAWFQHHKIARTILKIQMHHTYIPSYEHFDGSNHFKLQKSMRDHHVHRNGWSDIGQHFTIFPDGTILTGRSLELSPACIYQNNQDSICIENLGHFDKAKDQMHEDQKQAIVKITGLLCEKFNLPVNTDSIIYHHWFRLDNGHRNNGAGGNKSCPGTDFFGGNKVEDCEQNFIPLVKQSMDSVEPTPPTQSQLQKYVMVKAYRLNVRTGPSSRSYLAPDRDPVRMGGVLRIYDKHKSWLKISSSQNHWIYGRYTKDVKRYKVTATTLNVRSGPNISYSQVGQVYKHEQLFIVEEQGNWAKVAMDDRWVSKSYLTAF